VRAVFVDLTVAYDTVYGMKSFLSKQPDTFKSYRVYISPTI